MQGQAESSSTIGSVGGVEYTKTCFAFLLNFHQNILFKNKYASQTNM